jgi:hypothetical protein
MRFRRGRRQSFVCRVANGCGIDESDLREKAIAATRNGFHEAGALGGVTEGFTDFVDGFIEPVIEIHESVRGPNFSLELLASDDLAGMVEQHNENLQWLFLEADAEAVFAQFTGAKVQFKNPKPEASANLMVFLHGEVSLR